MRVKFKNKVLIIGYGAVARSALPLLLKHVDIPYKNITVIDFADKRETLRPWLKKGLNYFQERVTPINLAPILSRHVSSEGLVIDLAWNIGSVDMLNWCHDNRVLYVSTSMEEWDPYADIHKKTPFQKSLYHMQLELRKAVSKWQEPMITAVIDHGANPGLISHFTKKGLIDIARRVLRDKTTNKKEAKIIEQCLSEGAFARLAMNLGVKVIHVSEKDGQISGIPKRENEFVATWCIEALREECIAPSELGWGTHETDVPVSASFPPTGPRNQIFLSRMGMNTWVRSWVPNEEIVGMAVRHSESFSISDFLTVWREKKVIYRPTVHYVYMPCNETIASLHELRCRNYELQERLRIMSDEIIEGADSLGALLMGHKYNSWWTGSVLSIEESRRLVPHQNATTVQVAIGLVAAVRWSIEHPNEGLKVPEEISHEYVLDIARPYLGEFISIPSDWTPFRNYQLFFKENPYFYLDSKNPWSFKNFLFKG
ncbi:MAG: saccharopine dehydrogenase NADP-binding domain-containing protein [Candidatus Omnitrophica bacterium]|nr:saccharopine dehydrogenase NADP-binding domain-containing protein [Candidatus Omnitrophota bacterium]